MVSANSFMRIVSWYFQLAFWCHRLCSIFIKMSRECASITRITSAIFAEKWHLSQGSVWLLQLSKREYYLYFGCKVGDQEKKNGHHTCAALRVHPNSMRGWMEEDVVCCLECPWFEGCLTITVLTYFCMVPPIQNIMSMKKKINTCVSEYTISNSACASWRWTSCSWNSGQFCYGIVRSRTKATEFFFILTTKTVFLQTAKNSSHQLQEMQSTCQAQTHPIIRRAHWPHQGSRTSRK